MNINFTDVLDFWFKETPSEKWFQKDVHFDQLIREKFLALHTQAIACELWSWRSSAHGRLAEIIVLDQFSRNIYRSNPESFHHDSLALALAQEAVRMKGDEALNSTERPFLYMPFMHSESALIQSEGIHLFEKLGAKETLEYAIQHKRIIDQFGRFPHRNGVLGRVSTPKEIAFLKTPGSSF